VLRIWQRCGGKLGEDPERDHKEIRILKEIFKEIVKEIVKKSRRRSVDFEGGIR